MLIDSHCHLLASEYQDVHSEIKDAINKGIEKLIINGYDVASSKEAVELSKEYKEVYAAVGIGPENIDGVTDNDLIVIQNLAKEKKTVAVGEIGLDYYWTKENKEEQIKVFKRMLNIAKENNLPVIIHSRNSISDIYKIVKEYNITGIMHCYSGSKEMAKEFIKLGFLIGIGGVVTFKNAKEIKEVVKSINIENISLETDSPYLTPEPFRGKKNNPSNLKFIASKIAELKGVSSDEVACVTSRNVICKFYL